jgi:hypothetical protein
MSIERRLDKPEVCLYLLKVAAYLLSVKGGFFLLPVAIARANQITKYRVANPMVQFSLNRQNLGSFDN